MMTLKENRLVSLSKEQGCIHLQQTEWTSEQLQYEITVKLKAVPFIVQLFKVVATNRDIAWVITNCGPSSIDTQVVQSEKKVRLLIEQLHRELKQLTGNGANAVSNVRNANILLLLSRLVFTEGCG